MKASAYLAKTIKNLRNATVGEQVLLMEALRQVRELESNHSHITQLLMQCERTKGALEPELIKEIRMALKSAHDK